MSILKPLQRLLTAYVDARKGDLKEIGRYHRTFKRIMEKMQNSDAGYVYANKVVGRCFWFILDRELGRALMQYKFMVDNLKKQYNVE